MPLIQASTVIQNASNTAEILVAKTYFADPTINLVFGVAVVLAGLTVIIGVVLWMTHKVGNLFNRHNLGDSEHEYERKHHRISSEIDT